MRFSHDVSPAYVRRMSGKSRPVSPKQWGLWYEDTHGPRFKAPLWTGLESIPGFDVDPRTIILPNLHAVKYVNRDRLNSRKEHRESLEAFHNDKEMQLRAWRDPLSAMCEYDVSVQLQRQEQEEKKTRLVDLPNELLLQIFELLIPNGRIFNLGYTVPSKRKGKGERVFIQQMFTRVPIVPGGRVYGARITQPEHQPTVPGLLDLALVCKRLKDVAYRSFYGGNQFIVNVSGRRVLTVHVHDKTEGEICSWSKVRKEEERNGCFGLSSEVWRFIENLTVAVYVPSGERERGWMRSEEQVELLKKSFCGEKLNLCAGVVEKVKGMEIGALLELRESEGREGNRMLRMEMRNDIEMEIDDELKRRIRDLLEPLVQMDGLEQITFGGLLHELSVETERSGEDHEELSRPSKRLKPTR